MIKIINNEYILSITYKCNWNCSYCIEDTHNQDNVLIDSIYKSIDEIPNGSVVHLSGGEPGMVDKNIILKIIKKLKNKNIDILLDTNGLFLEKYPDLVDKYISDVVYHCVEDANNIVDIKRYKFKKLKTFTYMLIATDRNLKNIELYINNNQDIKFFISRAIQLSNKSESLHKIKGLYLINKYKNRMHPDSLKYLIGLENE